METSQPKIRIRPATVADLPLIRQIAHRTWPHTFGKILSPEQIDYMLEWMYSLPALEEQITVKSHRFLLAGTEEAELGYAGIEAGYGGDPVMRIHKLYVLPEAQGQGVGKALIEEIARIARAGGARKLHLNVNRDNPAVQFYQHLGFTVAGAEKIPIGNGFYMDDYIMERAL